MPTKVINQRTAVPGWRQDPSFVYIGRHAGNVTPTPGSRGYFGNPFKLEKGAARGATLDRYRAYAEERISNDPTFAEAVKGLAGKTLVCWCKPEACHGDVLAELADGVAVESPNRVPCPDCPQPGFEFVTTAGPMRCKTCGGSNEVTEAHAERLKVGREIRRMRVEVLGWSLREAGEELRVSARNLSGVEQGHDLFEGRLAPRLLEDLAGRIR